ncbi:MAG: hypothetical protein HY661_20460 [Betaproteobacteria bacterium]|nr:hypothetical protein [Betaproteobacteria bacterium]
MNTVHPRSTPAVLALIAGILASLVWASAAAQFSRPIANVVVPIAGTVAGAPEDVALSGRARVAITLVTDPDFGGPPRVILAIDLLNVFGEGQSSGAKYAATGEHKVLRLLRREDLVEVTFPVAPVGAKGTELVRPALLSFTLNFDVGNGRLERALAKFSAPQTR